MWPMQVSPFRATGCFFWVQMGREKRTYWKRLACQAPCVRFAKAEWRGWLGKGSPGVRAFIVFSMIMETNGKYFFLSGPRGRKFLKSMASELIDSVNTSGIFPQLPLSSRDFRLIREGPADRRKWLDLLLSSSSLSYFNHLQGYTRALRERNVLLKREASDGELLAFEQSLASHAVQLYSLRLQSLPQISKALSQSYLSLTDETEQADLAYAPDLSIESIEQYLEKLAEERPRDRIMGSCVKVRTAMIFFSAYKRGMHELMLPKGNSAGLFWLSVSRNFHIFARHWVVFRSFWQMMFWENWTNLGKQIFVNFFHRMLRYLLPVRHTRRNLNQPFGRLLKSRRALSLSPNFYNTSSNALILPSC